MIRTRRIVLMAAVAAALLPAAAAAQSDILLRLRSGSPLGDRFRIDSAGGLVAKGILGIGIIPASGQSGGEARMMWHPFKAAFRAGQAGDNGSVAWDDGNVGFWSWAGGYNTVASSHYTFSFGDNNTASAQSAVAMGTDNTASGSASFAMGFTNTAASFTSTALGRNAHAGTSFRGATVSQGGATAIGARVTADADWSFALGFRATTAGHEGAFVLGGTLAGASAATDSLEASADGQFSARFPGGYRLYTNTATTVGVSLNAGGSSWNVISDRNRKHDFLAVDGEDLLSRLRAVPVTTWRYRDEADRTVRHIGPMAQDWARAFGFSRDDTTINMSDFDGVNLAAIQALERRGAGQDQRVSSLESANAALRSENRQLRADADVLRAQNAAFAERLRQIEEALRQPRR
ncbi:MAG TPA: tail fiber domain-containing protein [Longimicrobium sp.]|nr:tail fiber domain-containing protein [Longimicrobium sp.]